MNRGATAGGRWVGDGGGDRSAPGALITAATKVGGCGRVWVGLKRSISVFVLPHVPDLKCAT